MTIQKVDGPRPWTKMDGHQKKKKNRWLHVHPWTKVDGHTKKKKKKMFACPSMNKSGRIKKKKKKKEEEEEDGCMSVNEQKWTDSKKIEDEVTLSHVGKSTTQSRQTKYL